MQNNDISTQIVICTAVDKVAAELFQLAASISEEHFNTKPFEDSWTPAQLVVHVTKSNNGIAQGMELSGSIATAKPGGRIAELKKVFLDFNHKLQSPDFILPKPGYYQKSSTMSALQQSNERLKKKGGEVNLSEVIEFHVLGEISKLELLYFVLYHTQRHIHQLNNMIKHFSMINTGDVAEQ